MTERPTGLYVGETTDPATHERNGTPIGLNPDDLTTHGVIVGMTGSGKTGLGMVVLEEALSAGIPTLILDPKGDMGNLLLTFPNLAPEDFAPWVPAGSDAAEVAQTWRDGLSGWGIDPTQIATLRTGHRMTVYTPGSTAGVPLNLIGSMAPPARPDGTPSADLEAIHDEVEALVQGLLGLIGVTSDPLSGREHVLMSNIVESAWAAGETIDLPTLLIRIQDPPMRKLGVIEVDTFFPKADRTALMMKLNGLLASPSFAAWGQGAPIDIDTMLWSPDGSANAAVVYLAHLSDEERQMVVTRILSKLVGWMRGQSGSTKLRVLVYMDEVYGFVPPTAAPPSKKPILTLFKQARAFGVGVILSTQNPVDLDYKAISNAGTWMIGRLQTERDKARLLEGMSSAAGTVDIATTDATISGLSKREFLLHTTGGKPPRTFGVRWAMSYLCGPLSKDQIAALPGAHVPEVSAITASTADAASTASTASSASSASSGAPVDSAVAASSAADPASSRPADLREDESPAMPAVADGIAVRFLDVAAPWAASLGAVPGGRRLQACLAIRVNLLFDETAADLRHTEQIEAVLAPLDDTSVDPASAIAVDYDDRDLRTDQPPGTVFVLPGAPIDTKKYFTETQAAVKDSLFRHRTTTISSNPALKLFGRPGESEAEFAARCAAAADAAADADVDKIRQKLEPRIAKLRQDIETAQQRAEQLEAEAKSSKTQSAINIGGSVLGALFGGRKSARSISGVASKVATGRSQSQKASNRMELALTRVEEKATNLEDLEAQLNDEITEIVAHWDAAATEVSTVSVPLEKTDITIEDIALVWVPTA